MDLWERQPREKDDAYNAFLCFRDLGKGRCLDQVAAKMGRTKRAVNKWAMRYDWQSRIKAYEVHEAQEVQKKRIDALEEMLERQVKIGQRLQTAAAESIRQRGLDRASFHSLAEILKIGMEMERTARQGLMEKAKEEDDNDIVITILPAKKPKV